MISLHNANYVQHERKSLLEQKHVFWTLLDWFIANESAVKCFQGVPLGLRSKHDNVYKGHTLPPVHRNYFIVPTEQGNEDSLQRSADLAVEEADESGNLATVHETGIDPNELDDQMKTHACLFLEQ